MQRSLARSLVLVFVSHSALAAAQDLPQESPPSPPPEAPVAPAPEPPPPDPAPAPAPENPAPAAPEPPTAAESAPPSLAPFPSEPPPPTASFPTPTPPPAPPPAAAAAVAAPVTTSTAAPPSKDAPPPSEDTKKKDDQDGLLGPFRIGPIVGVGLPSLINVGGMIKLTKYFAAGVDIGVAPSVSFAYYGDATVSFHSYEAYAHVHPFGGGLFLGAAIGYALAAATEEQVISVPPEYAALFPDLDSSVTLRSEGSVQTLVLTPELGYFYTFKSGFSLGVSAGVQIPVAPSDIEFQQGTNADVPDEILREYLDPTARAVRESLEKIGQTPLPTVSVSIGWLL